MSTMIRPLALMCAFIVGWFFPQGSAFMWTIPWFVRYMIFMTFLGLNVHKMKLRRSHFAILFFNIAIGMGACELFKYLDQPTLAAAAFFTGLAPTATAAPAIASFLRREVEYVVTGMLLTTGGIAIALPALLPISVGVETGDNSFWTAFMHVALRVLSTIVAPIAAARLLRLIYPNAATWTKKCKSATFYAWVLMVTVLSCGASEFIHNPVNGVKTTVLLEMLALSLGICVCNFVLGYFLGEKHYRQESSQTLGQKNTGLMVYFAMLYANPLVALGPTLYVLWHNSWNALQLEWQAIKDARIAHEEKESHTK